MHPQKKYLLIGIISWTLVFSFGFSQMASAHEIEPVTATPMEGEVLPASPGEVRLTFEEELEEAGSSLQVFNEQGAQVDPGNGGVDLNDAGHLSLTVRLPELPEGVYRVKWQVLLLDGDSSAGEYYFGVGNVTIPERASPTEAEGPSAAVGQAADPDSFNITWIGLGGGVVILAGFGIYLLKRPQRNP